MRARRDLGLLVALALASLVVTVVVAYLAARARAGAMRVQAYDTTGIPEARLYWLGAVSALVLLALASHAFARRRIAKHTSDLAVLDGIGLPRRVISGVLAWSLVAAAVTGTLVGALAAWAGSAIVGAGAVAWPLAAVAAAAAIVAALVGAWGGSARIAGVLERVHARRR